MSAETILSVPCLVFALRRESMHFRRAYPVRQRFPTAPCRAEFRYPSLTPQARNGACVLMLETGIGATAMESAVSWCLSEPLSGDVPYRPPLLISVGFSGALQPEQRVGDLVLATEVTDHQGKRWPAIIPGEWANLPIAAGRLLTVPELVCDPHEKQRLGRQYEALAVDMESAVAARLCHQHKVPFACLRVISDDWRTALSSQLVELLRRGRVSISCLAGQVFRHPKLISELLRLAGQTRLGSQKLAEALIRLHPGWITESRRQIAETIRG